MAEALARPRSRMAFGAAAALLLAGSALPLPAAPSDPTAVGLWPVPPVHLVAPAGSAPNGSARIDAGTARLERRPLADWLRLLHPFPVRESGFATLDPATFAADHSALYVHDDPAEGGGRYVTIPRLGNAVRKRVKFVPAACFEPYWRRMGVLPLGSLGDDYAVYRVRLAGRQETWLLAVAAGGRLRPELDKLGARPSHGQPAAGGPRLARGRETAEAILGFTAGSEGFVALACTGRRNDLWQLYLPFLLESTELYAAAPGQEGEMLRLLSGAPVLKEAAFGTAALKKTVYLGRGTSLIRGTAEPPPPPPPARPRRRRGQRAPGAGSPPGG
jgi:hypothetical protein